MEFSAWDQSAGASRRADRRSRHVDAADHARDEEIASALVQQALNERENFLDQTVAIMRNGRILLGKVSDFAAATQTWTIKLLDGSVITSQDVEEMSAAVTRMADLNEAAPPRTFDVPRQAAIPAAGALNRLGLPHQQKQAAKSSASGRTTFPVAAAKKSKHDKKDLVGDVPTGLQDLGRRVCVMYGGRFRVGVVVDFTPLSDLTSPMKPDQPNPEQKDHWRVRYFTGGEEELEITDLIDGLERFRILGRAEAEPQLVKEEQPFLDPTFGRMPLAKQAAEDEPSFKCDHCGKMFKSQLGLKYHERQMVCVRREERNKIVAERLGLNVVDATGEDGATPGKRGRRRRKLASLDPENTDDVEADDDDDNIKKRGRRTRTEPAAPFAVTSAAAKYAAQMLRVLKSPPVFATDLAEGGRPLTHTPLSVWARKHNISVPTHSLQLNLLAADLSTNLSMFSGTFVGAAGVDVYLNAGGPVWSLALHPGKADTSNRRERTHTCLAVGVSRLGWEGQTAAADSSYPIGERCAFPNVLQLWRFREELRATASVNQATTQPTCSVLLDYMVGHSRGPVWDLSWYIGAPTIGAASLGHLACVCGDGTCVIYRLPQLPVSSTEPEIADPRVVDEASVIRCELRLDDNVCILTAAWSPHEKGVLLTGLSDGSVCVWRLASFLDDLELMNQNDSSHAIFSQPDQRFVDLSVEQGVASMSAVRTVGWSPFHPHLFASGGYDGNLKVWQFNEPNKPAYTQRAYALGWVYDLTWCPLGNGIYFSGSDQPVCAWDPLWLISQDVRKRLYFHQETTHGCVWKTRAVARGDSSFTITASGGGSVIVGDVHTCATSKNRNRGNTRLFLIDKVQTRRQGGGVTADNAIESVEIDVQDANHQALFREPGQTTIIPPAEKAVYALATGPSPDDSDKASSGLVAYGTALGLVRCQTLPI